MKKSLSIIIVLVVLGLGVWYFGGDKSKTPVDDGSMSPTVSAPVSETTKVSDKLSEYKNEELGFSVKYPSVWEKTVGDNMVNFVIPTSKSVTNTLGKLESKIVVTSGKCAFPPVTTVKERKTITSGNLSFNMISMSNSVQGINYFDRMYSLQNEGVCYVFSFSSITLNPTTKGIKGSEATQVTNNNKAIVEASDQAFTTMVKSFAYVVGATGQDETQVVPAKK